MNISLKPQECVGGPSALLAGSMFLSTVWCVRHFGDWKLQLDKIYTAELKILLRFGQQMGGGC